MRGWVAISVTATPAGRAEENQEVLRIIIRISAPSTEQDMIFAAGIRIKS